MNFFYKYTDIYMIDWTSPTTVLSDNNINNDDDDYDGNKSSKITKQKKMKYQ